MYSTHNFSSNSRIQGVCIINTAVKSKIRVLKQCNFAEIPKSPPHSPCHEGQFCFLPQSIVQFPLFLLYPAKTSELRWDLERARSDCSLIPSKSSATTFNPVLFFFNESNSYTSQGRASLDEHFLLFDSTPFAYLGLFILMAIAHFLELYMLRILFLLLGFLDLLATFNFHELYIPIWSKTSSQVVMFFGRFEEIVRPGF